MLHQRFFERYALKVLVMRDAGLCGAALFSGASGTVTPVSIR
jgi:hypothetical protein